MSVISFSVQGYVFVYVHRGLAEDQSVCQFSSITGDTHPNLPNGFGTKAQSTGTLLRVVLNTEASNF